MNTKPLFTFPIFDPYIDPYVALSKNNLLMLKEYYKTHDIFEENEDGKTILEVATEMLENDEYNDKLRNCVDFLRNVEEQSYLILENPEGNDIVPPPLDLDPLDLNGFFDFLKNPNHIYENKIEEIRDIFELCRCDLRSGELLNFLQNNPSTVNEKDDFGWTPLHYTVRKNSKKCMKILIDYGADINSKDNYGETPLLRAAIYDSDECLELLLNNGADINIKDDNGKTPLHCAVRGKSEKCLKILLNNTSTSRSTSISTIINSQDNDGNTPLHDSNYICSKKITKMLLDYGADTTIKNNDGYTFLDLIEENDHLKQEIKKYIEDLDSLIVKVPCEDDVPPLINDLADITKVD